MVQAIALLAIAHAELNAEVHPNADEQNRERDRNHVERADHHQTERECDRQPREQRDEHCENHLARAHRQPQHDQHGEQRDDRVRTGVLTHGGELLVGQRARARQTHRRAIALTQLQVGHRLANARRGIRPGFESGVVHLRLHLDVAAGHGVGRDERSPRHGRRTPGKHRLGRLGRIPEQVRHLRQLDLPGEKRRLQRHRQQVRQTGQARVLRQTVEQGLGVIQLARERLHVVERREEQRVVRKELPRAGTAHRPEHVGLGHQLRGQLGGGPVGELGGRGLHYGQGEVCLLRESAIDGTTALGGGRIQIDQTRDIRVDREVLGDVHATRHHEQERSENDQVRVLRRKTDDAHDERRQHVTVPEESRGLPAPAAAL